MKFIFQWLIYRWKLWREHDPAKRLALRMGWDLHKGFRFLGKAWEQAMKDELRG